MKITCLDQYFKTRNMIGGTRGYEMARRLVAMGHEVSVVTSDFSESPRRGWRLSIEDGIAVHRIGVPYSNSMAHMRRIWSFFYFAVAAAHRAASLPSDLLFATSTPLTIALPAAYAKRRKGVPLVFEVRDLWPEVPVALGVLKNRPAIALARWLERFAYRHSTRIVALSPGMKAGICRTGVPKERVRVIPNSADLDLFEVPSERGRAWRALHPELGNRPIVLYAGTIGAANGVAWLARVAAECLPLDPEVAFVVVGDGRERQRLARQANAFGVSGHNFYIFPAVAKKQMPDVLSAGTICTSLVVNCSAMWANSANKFFDALAAARPVGINYRGWQAELLEEYGAGVVLPATDTMQAARALTARLRDSSWLEQAAAAAGRLARERFDRETLAAEFEETLLAAVSGKSLPESCSSA